MTTTEEMKEKLLKENQELEEKIKYIDEQKKPMERQLLLNKRVLAVINKQKLGMGKRKYVKKAKEEKDKI